MAKITNISDKKNENNFLKELYRTIQSTHLNFIVGSGCSLPAIKVLGNIEEKVTKQIDAGNEEEANKKLYEFILPMLDSTDSLISKSTDKEKDKETKEEETKEEETIKNYSLLLKLIARFIFERKGNLFPKQASVFTTNYDLFMEKASDESNGAYYMNDGFIRSPSLNNVHLFSTSEFFISRKKCGYQFNYEVEVPSINLIKLHGSFSWAKHGDDDLKFSVQTPERLEDIESPENVKSFNENLSIVLPNKDKFEHTFLKQTYYDLLRIYSNELEKENSLIIALGFSFADEHLLEITKRALRNPTSKLIISCFNEAASESLEKKFKGFMNVECIYKDENFDFSNFLKLLSRLEGNFSGEIK